MEGPYGTEWPVEEKVKRREMVAPEARYIFVYEEAMSEQQRPSATCVEERAPILGFLHFRFLIEEELPVLYVYELQLEPRVQGKGLGKFLMQLIELIALKVLNSHFMLIFKRRLNIILNGRVMSEDLIWFFNQIPQLFSVWIGFRYLCQLSIWLYIYILLHQHSMSIVLPGV